MKKLSHGANRTLLLTSVLAFGWVVFIWTYRFVPMEDYPLWLHAGQVFSRFIHGQAVSDFRLIYWPIPNSAFVGIVGLLDLFFRPEISGKIFLSACAVLFIVGAYALVGSLTTRRDSALFMLPMLYVLHRSVWAGELSFSFGLGLLLIAMALALRRASFSFLNVLCISVALFYSHAIPYFCWLIFLVLLAIFDSSRFPRLKTVLAVSPSLALFSLYLLHRETNHGSKISFGLGDVLRQTPRFWSLFSPLHFFDPFYASDPQWLKVAATVFNACTVAIVVALIVFWFWKLPARLRAENGPAKAALVAPLIFFFVFVIFPFKAFTGVFDFNYRFLLPAFILVLATLIPVVSFTPPFRTIAACAAALALSFQFYYTCRVSQEMAQIYATISQSNLGPDFRDIAHNEFEPRAPVATSETRILPVHEALAYFADYLRTERQWPDKMFSTSIVRSTATYPAVLDSVAERLPLPGAIVILGLQKQNRTLVHLFPGRYHITVDAQYLLILQADSGPGNQEPRSATVDNRAHR